MDQIDIRLAQTSDISFLIDIFSSKSFVEHGMRRLSIETLTAQVKDGFLFDFDSGNGFLILDDKMTGEQLGVVKVTTSLRNQLSVINGGVIDKCFGSAHSRTLFRETMRFLFSQYPIARIEGNILATNTRSIRFQEKMGLVREGLKRKAWFHKGALCDQVVMGILRAEFLALYEPTPELMVPDEIKSPFVRIAEAV